MTTPKHDYRVTKHTTTFTPPPPSASMPASFGMSDAQAMLNIYASWRDEAIQRGDDISVLHYDDCVNFYAAKVEREKAVAL